MSRVTNNWERLVGATLKRELGQGHERTSSGIAGAVPPSLARTTIIDAILQAADEIQDEDPNADRICKFLYIDSRYNFTNIQLLLHFEVFLVFTVEYINVRAVRSLIFLRFSSNFNMNL